MHIFRYSLLDKKEDSPTKEVNVWNQKGQPRTVCFSTHNVFYTLSEKYCKPKMLSMVFTLRQFPILRKHWWGELWSIWDLQLLGKISWQLALNSSTVSMGYVFYKDVNSGSFLFKVKHAKWKYAYFPNVNTVFFLNEFWMEQRDSIFFPCVFSKREVSQK